jgi:hypothetical protein
MRVLRALIVLSCVVAATIWTTGAANAATGYHVTIHVNKHSIDDGTTLHLNGRVTKGPVAGRSVVLAWTTDPDGDTDTWHTIGDAKLSKAGYWSRGFKPKAGGEIYVRALKTRVGGHAKGDAVTSLVKVYQWGDWTENWNFGELDDPGANGATTAKGPAVSGGKTYKGSLLINDGAQANFSSYECTAVRGTVRIPASSASSTGGIDLNQDDPLGSVFATKSSAHSFNKQLDPNEAFDVVGSAGGGGGTSNVVAVTGFQFKCDQPAG